MKPNSSEKKKNDEALRTSFKDTSIITFPIIHLISRSSLIFFEINVVNIIILQYTRS